MTFNEDWEREARNWIAWARTPQHDAYWQYSPLFFELVPAPGTATLEIGCGEGRVARDLASRGHRVTAVDASPTLLEAAREAQPDVQFVLAARRSSPSRMRASTAWSRTTRSWTSRTCRARCARRRGCCGPTAISASAWSIR